MSTDPAFLAARNNAAWCDAVCRSSGGATELRSGLWWNARPSSPYFPSLITVEPAVDFAQVEALLQAASGDGSVIGVKDSFCTLDLSSSGFSRLFEACWIWRDPAPQEITTPELRWTKVASQAELQLWEREWHPDRGSRTLAESIYGASLLRCQNISFVAAFEGSALVAGAALTATESTVGLTCTFFRGPNPQQVRRELISFVNECHPGCPILGYESGDELAAMKALGFREVGPLRVWLGSAAR